MASTPSASSLGRWRMYNLERQPLILSVPWFVYFFRVFSQMAVFHALGLAPVRHTFFYNIPIPLDTRRVVLLVPKSGLPLLRDVSSTEIFLSLSEKVGSSDNHFASIHTAFVKVRRGSSYERDDCRGWWSLTSNLKVHDAREDDPGAEFMVSALVPAYALMMAPPELTALQLRSWDSTEMFAAPEDVMDTLGGQTSKVLYKADLSNVDKTAVLIPGATENFCQGEVSCPFLPCPEVAATYCSNNPSSQSSPRQVGPNSDQAATKYRFTYGGAAVDQSIGIIDQAEGRGEARLVYRVALNMVSAEAREVLAAGSAPAIENTLDPCTVRVKMGKGVSHVIRFPFPMRSNTIEMKFRKRQGLVVFTVNPQSSPRPQPPFAWTTYGIQGVGHSRVLPSMMSWSPCPPLSSLPRLDFNAEWAHEKVNCKIRREFPFSSFIEFSMSHLKRSNVGLW